MKTFLIICVLLGTVSVHTQSSGEDWKVKFSEELRNLKERVEVLEKANSECREILHKDTAAEIEIKIEESTSNGTSVSIENKTLEERVEFLEEKDKVKTLRTCEEYASYGISTSGLYTIDPDGNGIGMEAIQVFCNFTEKSTQVMHDKEFPVEIAPCPESYCYRLNLSYSAPLEQIVALMELSETCDQSISFSCFQSPLSIGDDPIGVWINRNGGMEEYYTGDHHGEHLCTCALDNTCSDSEHGQTCNCDATIIPEMQEDHGILTDGSSLPVIGFLYGDMKYPSQFSSIYIGRLKCRGQKQVPTNEITDSCSNLKRSGVVQSGHYILNDESIAFCDMEKGIKDNDIEKHVGDITYKDALFFATSNTQRKYIPTGRISFDSTEFDYFGNFEHSTGTFTASRDGIHAFFFSGYSGSITTHLRLDIYVNGVLDQFFDKYDSDTTEQEQVTQWWSLNLSKGDEVYLSNYESDSFKVYDDYDRMYFMGYFVN